jgi:hypothetical protein
MKETDLHKTAEEEAAKRAKGYYGEFAPETTIAFSFFMDGVEWLMEQLKHNHIIILEKE